MSTSTTPSQPSVSSTASCAASDLTSTPSADFNLSSPFDQMFYSAPRVRNPTDLLSRDTPSVISTETAVPTEDEPSAMNLLTQDDGPNRSAQSDGGDDTVTKGDSPTIQPTKAEETDDLSRAPDSLYPTSSQGAPSDDTSSAPDCSSSKKPWSSRLAQWFKPAVKPKEPVSILPDDLDFAVCSVMPMLSEYDQTILRRVRIGDSFLATEEGLAGLGHVSRSLDRVQDRARDPLDAEVWESSLNASITVKNELDRMYGREWSCTTAPTLIPRLPPCTPLTPEAEYFPALVSGGSAANESRQDSLPTETGEECDSTTQSQPGGSRAPGSNGAPRSDAGSTSTVKRKRWPWKKFRA